MTETLKTDEGILAYDDCGGNGPLLILAPSLGDLRQEYRLLAPILTEAGWRVVTMDLRGQGEASVDWPQYTPEAVGRDMLDLTRHIDAGPAVLGGCSLAAAAAVWAAVEAPERVAGIVLFGPALRDPQLTAFQSGFMRVGFSGPWRVRAWDLFYGSLYKKAPPVDLADYRRRLRANLNEPGRFDALNQFLHATKAASEARMASVKQPALVIMGAHDPDFPDAAAEARTLAERLHGEVTIVEDAGHYPQVEQPALVADAIGQWSAAHLPQFSQSLKQSLEQSIKQS